MFGGVHFTYTIAIEINWQNVGKYTIYMDGMRLQHICFLLTNRGFQLPNSQRKTPRTFFPGRCGFELSGSTGCFLKNRSSGEIYLFFFKTSFCSSKPAFFLDVFHQNTFSPPGTRYHTYTRWWFQRFFIFTPIPGEMIQFDEHIFPRGWFNHHLVYSSHRTPMTSIFESHPPKKNTA